MNKSESKYFNTAIRMDRALIALLEKKELAYITVSEICQQAGVNRSTFYLHYETVGDLLEETTRYMLDEFMAYFTVDTRQIAVRFDQCALRELNFITADYLHPYLSYIRDNRRVFATALDNSSAFGFEDVFRRLFEHIFDPILERFHYPVHERPYVMQFYLNGLNAVVLQWLKNGCTESVEELSRIIQDCVFGRDPSLLTESQQ